MHLHAGSWVQQGCSLVQPGLQAIILVLVTLVAYYYAFFDVARADQLIYLYRTSEIHGLWNLTVRAYDFNRTNSIGDFILFRPLLYMLLGLERWLWGYNFTLWQATSINLHILVVLSLFTYCHRGCRRFLAEGETSFAPFFIALFFALLYAGTEMVAWHHIVGYLLFCLLAVQGALAYQSLIEKRDATRAALLFTIVGLACFTYELGNLMAWLMAAGLLFTITSERRTAEPSRNNLGSHGILFVVTSLLLWLPILYVVWSYTDYAAKIGPIPQRAELFAVRRFLWGFAKSVGFWLSVSLFPATLHLAPGSRIHVAPPFPIVDPLSFLSSALAFLVITCTVWQIRHRRFPLDLVHDWSRAAIALVLALGYAGIIVMERGMASGVIWALSNNSYYAYIFTLFCLMAYFHLVVAPSVAATMRLTPALCGSYSDVSRSSKHGTVASPISRFPSRRTVRASSTFHGSLRMPSKSTSATPLLLRSFRTANVVNPVSILSNVQDHECGSGASCTRARPAD